MQYRWGPEHPAPAAHDDVFAAYQWALSQGYAPKNIAVSGDSAGGNMALATVLRARDEGIGLPAALFVMSPALELHEAEPDPVYTEGHRQMAALIYASGTTGRPKGVMLSHRGILYTDVEAVLNRHPVVVMSAVVGRQVSGNATWPTTRVMNNTRATVNWILSTHLEIASISGVASTRPLSSQPQANNCSSLQLFK